jgi:hypothetical protein
VVKLIAKRIFLNVGIDGKQFEVMKFAKTFRNLGFPQPNRFDFGTGQYHTGRIRFEYFVVETGAFVEYVYGFNHRCKDSRKVLAVTLN